MSVEPGDPISGPRYAVMALVGSVVDLCSIQILSDLEDFACILHIITQIGAVYGGWWPRLRHSMWGSGEQVIHIISGE